MASPEHPPFRRPNVLILYTDQQRWDTLRANGNSDILTPNLDRLVARGLNFNHCFVQNPVCMPSRVSMLTGRYPSALGITHMGVPVPEDTVTLPRLLKPYGYRSANFGKLHFQPHANRDHRRPHPDYGFDQLEISDEPGVYEDAYRAWVRARAPEQLDHLSPGLPPSTHEWNRIMDVKDSVRHPAAGGRSDFDGAMPHPAHENVTHTAFVADRTLDFLSRQTGETPFLCISGFYAPHSPWIVPQRYLDLYEARHLSPQRLGYLAAISEVDHHVGRILDQLDRSALADNTIIVFTSDHGEWLGEHGRWGKGYPGLDPVARVPLIISAPGRHATHGHTTSAIVEAVDIVPTLLDLAAIQPPPDLNGESLAPALRDPAFAGKSAALMEFTGWKNLRSRSHRYLVHADGRECLWDLEADPGELHDLAGDPHHRETLTTHRHLLLQRLLVAERPLPRTWTY